mmetsp:Transcript_26994/g.42368  ORF Transcript_26994/g.42368 Transcript_26994/m.42368 type:complete len:329 (+) Transcript_26994:8-994(+)
MCEFQALPPYAHVSVILMVFVLASRIYFHAGLISSADGSSRNVSSKRRRRASARSFQAYSIFMILCWVAYTIALLAVRCSISCSKRVVAFLVCGWATCNSVQYCIYFLRARAVVCKAKLLVGKGDGRILKFIKLPLLVNLGITLFVMVLGSTSSHKPAASGECREVEGLGIILGLVYCVLDFYLTGGFLYLFLSPIVRNHSPRPPFLSARTNSQNNAQMHNFEFSSRGLRPRKDSFINRIIWYNMIGFVVSQAAQTAAIVGGIFIWDTSNRYGPICVLVLLNLVGISIMFQDLPKCLSKSKYLVIALVAGVVNRKHKRKRNYQVGAEA